MQIIYYLADPHFVDDFQLHAGSENGIDRLPDFEVKVGGEGAGSGQPLDQKVFPVVVFGLDGWKTKTSIDNLKKYFIISWSSKKMNCYYT